MKLNARRDELKPLRLVSHRKQKWPLHGLCDAYDFLTHGALE